MRKAFSLIELLVALSILAVVAAIIVPRFMGLRDAAQRAVVEQNIGALNSALANWQAAGGTFKPLGTWFDAPNVYNYLALKKAGGGTTSAWYAFYGGSSMTDTALSAGIGLPANPASYGSTYFALLNPSTGTCSYASTSNVAAVDGFYWMNSSYPLVYKSGRVVYEVRLDTTQLQFSLTGTTFPSL